ncbi:hypothetical protein AAG589_16130 [Isoptericola sp. F-RaC21]|uniref:hypothetical protein n=1 Tax=Isoptericola sp. F-RaC21 TaxID=3141452 RepID=UPI00315B949C
MSTSPVTDAASASRVLGERLGEHDRRFAGRRAPAAPVSEPGRPAAVVSRMRELDQLDDQLDELDGQRQDNRGASWWRHHEHDPAVRDARASAERAAASSGGRWHRAGVVFGEILDAPTTAAALDLVDRRAETLEAAVRAADDADDRGSRTVPLWADGPELVAAARLVGPVVAELDNLRARAAPTAGELGALLPVELGAGGGLEALAARAGDVATAATSRGWWQRYAPDARPGDLAALYVGIVDALLDALAPAGDADETRRRIVAHLYAELVELLTRPAADADTAAAPGRPSGGDADCLEPPPPPHLAVLTRCVLTAAPPRPRARAAALTAA